MSDEIVYETTTKPVPEELLAFYQRQKHRTTADVAKLKRMIAGTYCFVTARRDGEIIGLARGITDGLWGLLLECKLDPEFQGPACITRTDGRIEHDQSGIAREMAVRVIEALRNHGVERIDAMAYGTEVDFCEELGFRKLKGIEALELDCTKPIAHPHPV